MQYIKQEKELEDGTRVCFDLQNLDELEQILVSEREKIKKGKMSDEKYTIAGMIAFGVGALLLIISFFVACKLMADFKYGALFMYASGIIMTVGFVLYLVSYKKGYDSPWWFEIANADTKYSSSDYRIAVAIKEIDWNEDIVMCEDGNSIRYISRNCEYKWLSLPGSIIHYWNKDYIEIRGYLDNNKHRYVCTVWKPLNNTPSSLDRFTGSLRKKDGDIERREEYNA